MDINKMGKEREGEINNMIENIKIVIDYIDENYHDVWSTDKIKELINVSVGHFRNEFKEIVGISLDNYRIRRELTLIINEIQENNKTINNSNLLPWSDNNGFYSSFKKEFGIPPKQYLMKKNNYVRLQEKFNIESFNNDEKLIKALKKEYGSYEKSLVYLLSLPVYKRDGFSAFVQYKDDNEFYWDLIRDYYCEMNGERLTLSKVPKEYYKKHIKNLRKYYDKDKCIQFDTFENGIDSKEYSVEEHFFSGAARKVFVNPMYIVVKRSLIRKLFKLVNIEKFFASFNIIELKTIWHAMIIGERKSIDNCVGIMPNELIEQTFLTFGQWTIVHEIVVMENGAVTYNNLDEFRENIKYDYDKPIETEWKCDRCNFKEYEIGTEECKYDCDDTCPRDEVLTEEEKEIFNKAMEWEKLDMDALKHQLVNFMIRGLVYL